MRILILLSALWFAPNLNTDSANDIVGTWLVEAQNAKVKIYKAKNNKYYGKIVWLKEPLHPTTKQPVVDANNPDEELQDQEILGMLTVKDLVYKRGKWEGGTIYQPQSGRTYKCKAWLEDGKLNMRGYWGMLYGTSVWTKVK